ncbi:phage-like element PBSX protein XkdP [Geomicrobium sp. JCM 19037]|uniref:LysM peptidoglycan-binding domain-containing protein n=1 Tax=Geomicrobium sp. JCM 19037 TaxID=1460634 RepID=UPI00045F2EEA|nr:LysM peptidoglycan-binding domain-containing protein [Geomicrobium sp. JCM 19037]GAK03249.1 phage-like element PBSX protein XkdP [Geomicrobium sp. JCM 19037]
MKDRPIEIWLQRGDFRIRLPVLPESIQVSTPYDFTDVQVAQLGEYTVQGFRGLKTYSFSTFLPYEYNPLYCAYSQFMKPKDMLAKFEEWRERTPQARLIITGGSADINTHVTIRAFPHELERFGSPGDVYVDFELKEFVEQEIREITPGGNSATKDKRPPKEDKPKPRTYTVKRGDTLTAIALDELKDANKWRQIYEQPANRKLIGGNPHLIQPGQKLVIP